MASPEADPRERETVRVLLATSRDWFASALGAVLEPEGFAFTHVRSAALAIERALESRPDIVVIDEGLPDSSAADVCRGLISGPLGSSVPVLVYSPNFWHEREQAEAMRAGAWDIIREPIRSNLLVAKLERLLGIKRLIETAEEESLSDADTGLFSLPGLIRTLPILSSVAERSNAPLACAIVGPTVPAAGPEAGRQRARTARLCQANTRMSDVCAWVAETDVAVLVYGADVSGATTMARRLSREATPSGPDEAARDPLSAGIVELSPAELVTARRRALEEGTPGLRSVADRIAGLGRFAAAQTALEEARQAGGGIRIAGSV